MKQILTVILFQLAVFGLTLQHAYLHPISCGTDVAAIAFSETHLKNDADRLARSVGTSAEDVRAAELVQFIDWRSNDVFRFSLTYQPRGGRLVIVNVSPRCGVEYQFSTTPLSEPV